jgi:large subunit ribosomal protein L10
LKGGEIVAISKQRKEDLVLQYVNWLQNSQAFFFAEYKGLTMKDVDELRRRVREVGGEFHVVKNTLGKVAFKSANLIVPESLLQGSSAVAVAFKDAPSLAKVVSEFARTSDFVKIKGGILGNVFISPEDVTALAELPPLPVLRAQLLGTILAPASRLVRTLAEPARQVAAVFKAFADQEPASVEA